MRIRIPLAVLVSARLAHASCPEGQANCILHEEGVALLTAGNFDAAAAKFQASLAAGATARAALGYAQAIEGQGKIALAYESMLYAKQLSDAEINGPDGKNVDIVGRSQRVQYKLAELRAKVGFVQVKLPPNVPPRRLVSLRRKGEGDLVDPLTRWVVVAPDHQVLVAALDDGASIEVDAQVAAGMQGSVVIPIGGAVRTTNVPRSRPIEDLYPKPQPTPAVPPPDLDIGIDFITLVPNPDNMTSGFGATALLEKRLGTHVGMMAKVSYVQHPETTLPGNVVSSGEEVITTIGLRTASKYSFYAFFEAGALVFTTHAQVPVVSIPPRPPVDMSATETFPAVQLGAATRLGRIHLQTGLLWAIATGDKELPVRFMASLGVDLVKK